MEAKKQKVDMSSSRVKVWTSALTSTLAALLGVISSLVSVADLLRLPMAIVVGVTAVAVTAGFTFVLARRERGPSRLARLKDDLAAAYIHALDQSSLNPAGGRHR